MIPQTYPLYATRGGETFLVVGWRETPSHGIIAWLVPVSHSGEGCMAYGPVWSYSPEPPASEPAPDPAPDETAVIPAYRTAW